MKHLLIDFENVQPQNLDKLLTENTHIWLFIGVLHKMLPISLVQSLLRFGERVHLVQLQKTGKTHWIFTCPITSDKLPPQTPMPKSAYSRVMEDTMFWSNIF
nr:PIN domain-containing protein [Neisseria meningitidis]